MGKIRNVRRKEETKRVLESAKEFVTHKGAVIAFQKNAWNNFCSENGPEYKLKLARAWKLKGYLKGDPKVPVL